MFPKAVGTLKAHGLFFCKKEKEPMNLVLIGYRCSGKTVTGRELAGRLGRPFMDTDALVVREAGAPVADVVRKEGWEHFRDLESGVIRRLAARDGLVIATGGGVVVREENIQVLRAGGWLVWLDAGPSELVRRMMNDREHADQRPALGEGDPFEETNGVLRERAPLYRKAADLCVETDRLTPTETAARIMTSIPR